MQAVTKPQVEDSVLDMVYDDMRQRGVLWPTTPSFQAAMVALRGRGSSWECSDYTKEDNFV